VHTCYNHRCTRATSFLHHLGMRCSLQKNVQEQNQRKSGLISATVEGTNFIFVTQLVFGTSLAKITLRTNIGGGPG